MLRGDTEWDRIEPDKLRKMRKCWCFMPHLCAKCGKIVRLNLANQLLKQDGWVKTSFPRRSVLRSGAIHLDNDDWAGCLEGSGLDYWGGVRLGWRGVV